MTSSGTKDRPTFLDEVRALVRLATPVALAQLGLMTLGVVDVMMVGHLSKDALAAVSLGNIYTFGFMVLGMGILFVLDPLISQAYGARDMKRLSEALHRGIVLAFLLSIPFGIIFFTGRPLLLWLSEQPEVVPISDAYARVIAYSLPFFFLFTVLKQTLQAMSIVRPVLIAVLVGNIANVFLNLGFVYGHYGFPALGAVGSAWATTVCRLLMAVMIILLALPSLKKVWHPPGREVLKLVPYGQMVGKGLQIGIQIALEVWMFVAVSFLMMQISVVAMGGHTIAMNLSSLSFMIPVGIGAAAATRVGNAIGRDDPDGARRSAKAALFIGSTVMIVFAAAFIFLPGPLARLYSDDAQVVALAMVLLPIAGFFQVFDGTQAVASGILRGVAETRIPMVINFVGYWLLGIPIGLYFAFERDMGPRGLWVGLTVGLSTCAVLLVILVSRRVGRVDRLKI